MVQIMCVGCDEVRRTGRRGILALVPILALCCLVTGASQAATPTPGVQENLNARSSGRLPAPIASVTREQSEHLDKAAALHRFPGYVEWPGMAFANADAPIVVGIVGAREIADTLESMSVERTVGGRTLRVLRLSPSAPLPAMHMLFIGSDQREHIAHLLGHVAGQPVLTVTEVPDGLALGSIINFWTDQRVRFEISLFAAKRSDLRLSSRLLPIASSVRSESP